LQDIGAELLPPFGVNFQFAVKIEDNYCKGIYHEANSHFPVLYAHPYSLHESTHQKFWYEDVTGIELKPD
jgi:hypothetical protein